MCVYTSLILHIFILNWYWLSGTTLPLAHWSNGNVNRIYEMKNTTWL